MAAGGSHSLLIAAAAPDTLPVDFNSDGIVDAADYFVWRNGLGTTYTAAHYDQWRSNFGTSAVGAGGTAVGSVPNGVVSVKHAEATT